jgi:hypothetical protein
MTSNRSSRRAVTCVAATIALPVLALLSGCDSGGDSSEGAPVISEGVDLQSVVTFVSDDAHANLPPEEGCDQLNFHASMAMWNPALADELLDYSCPFPYEPDLVSMDGGSEDSSLSAAYEPRRYQEIYDIIASEMIGICAITRVGEPSVGGFVYGFNNTLRAETCAKNDPNIELATREYASRAHRDEAAHRLAESVGRVLVLGRWVVSLDGDDPDALGRLSTRLEQIGASPVTP